MPPKLPPHDDARIKLLLTQSNRPLLEISAECGVTVRQLYKMRSNLRAFGAVRAPRTVVVGRPRALTEEQELRVLDFISERPTSYMDEVAWWIFDEFDVVITASYVAKMMKRRKISHKAVKRVAAERSQELRAIWFARRLNWHVEELVFVDESAANEVTAHRKRGWSPIGQPCHDVKLFHRSERWSILPAITIEGYLEGTLIVQGSISGEMFEEWLDSVILPQLEPGMIVIMDNASIHRTDRVRRLFEERGLQLEYLPPYSPDLNPIEQSFHSLKELMRRHQDDVALYQDFGNFLRARVEDVVGRSARTFFEMSGYVEPEDES